MTDEAPQVFLCLSCEFGLSRHLDLESPSAEQAAKDSAREGKQGPAWEIFCGALPGVIDIPYAVKSCTRYEKTERKMEGSEHVRGRSVFESDQGGEG